MIYAFLFALLFALNSSDLCSGMIKLILIVIYIPGKYTRCCRRAVCRMTWERRLLNRKCRAVKYHVPLKVSADFPGWTGRNRVRGWMATGWICQGQCRSESEAGPVERDRCVARLITYLRLHYCKQCISLYVRSLLPFVLSCLPTYLPDARLSRPVVHLAVIYSARAIPSRAKLLVPLKATLSPRCILKRLGARIYPSPAAVSVRSCFLPHPSAGSPLLFFLFEQIIKVENFVKYGAICD